MLKGLRERRDRDKEMQVGMGEAVLWMESEAKEKRGQVVEIGPLKRQTNPCAREQERQRETRRICFCCACVANACACEDVI